MNLKIDSPGKISAFEDSLTHYCVYVYLYFGSLGVHSIGKNPDFPIERKIQKRISPTRNPSSGWISIKKSKTGFFGFPFYHSIGKSEKGFAKPFSWTAVFFLLIMRAHARPLFVKTVFQILFRISHSNGKKESPKKKKFWRWNTFSDFAFDCKSEIRTLKSKSRFPNQTHPRICMWSKTTNVCCHGCWCVCSLPVAIVNKREGPTEFNA